MSNEVFERLRLDVWSAVVKRDDWWTSGPALPNNIDDTLFYRAVILAYNSGLPVTHILPKVDDILSLDSWSQHFTDDTRLKQFEYVLRSGYEQMESLGVMQQIIPGQ